MYFFAVFFRVYHCVWIKRVVTVNHDHIFRAEPQFGVYSVSFVNLPQRPVNQFDILAAACHFVNGLGFACTDVHG